MNNSFVIGTVYQRSHRNNILRIIIINIPQRTKLTFSGRLIGYDERNLYVNGSRTILGTNKVNFTSLQLSHVNRIPIEAQLIINYALDNLFYVLFPSTTQ